MLYVIQSVTGPIKIGVATDLGSRLPGIQTGNSSPLVLLGFVDVKDDYSLEKKTHKALEKHRLTGEWFDNSVEVCNHVTRLLRCKEGRMEIPPARKTENIFAGIRSIINEAVHEAVKQSGRENDNTRRLIKIREVEKMVGLKKSALYKYVASGDFPPQIRIGPRSVAWEKDAVDRWISQRLNYGAEGESRTRTETSSERF